MAIFLIKIDWIEMEKTASGLRMGGQLHVLSRALLLKARIKVLERQDKLF